MKLSQCFYRPNRLRPGSFLFLIKIESELQGNQMIHILFFLLTDFSNLEAFSEAHLDIGQAVAEEEQPSADTSNDDDDEDHDDIQWHSEAGFAILHIRQIVNILLPIFPTFLPLSSLLSPFLLFENTLKHNRRRTDAHIIYIYIYM
jgi:hypothetical protein